jgi:recombination protein RecT
MSTSELKAVATGAASAKPKDFPAMLQVWLPEIKKALPKHLNADRMSRIALTAFRRTPKLAECDPRSVFAAVIQASQLGLEPDTLGRSYLIPYANRKKVGNQWTTSMECQFVPGWKGLMDLMNRSGQGSAWTGAVFEGDFFEYQLGDSPFVRHIPAGEDSPEKMTHVYAVGRAKGAEWPVIEVWPIAKVRKHRDRYNKVGEKHYSHGNWEMYARKVVLLQVLKYLPCSAELAAAMALNDAAEVGAQKIDLKDAIEGQWEHAIDDAAVESAGTGGNAGGAPSETTLYDDVKSALSKASDNDSLALAHDLYGELSNEHQAELAPMLEAAKERVEKARGRK